VRVVLLIMLLALSPLFIDRALQAATAFREDKAETEAELEFSYGSMPRLTVGETVSLKPSAEGSPEFFLHGSLPPGFELAKDGTITGTPTKPGTHSFRIVAASGAQRGSETLRLVVRDRLSIEVPGEMAFTSGEETSSGSEEVSVSGGDGLYDISLYEHPDWLTIGIDGSVKLLGDIPPEGDYTAGINVEDGEGRTASAVLRIRILPPPPSEVGTLAEDMPLGSIAPSPPEGTNPDEPSWSNAQRSEAVND